MRWYCRTSSWERAAASGSCSLACGCLQQVATALPGCSGHTPPDLHGCCFSPPSLWWVGVWGDPQHLLGSSILCLYALGCWHWFVPSKAKPNSLSLGSLQKQNCFVRYGTMGVFHWLHFKTLFCCRGTFCSGLKARTLLTSVWMYQQWVLLRAATAKDRQAVFPLGLAPVRFSPSEPVWLIFSAKGKTTSRKTQIFSELTHAILRLEANLKASFWVTHASPSLLVLLTSHHDFYIKSHKWS